MPGTWSCIPVTCNQWNVPESEIEIEINIELKLDLK